MRITIIIFFFSFTSFAQKDFCGLYGECDKNHGGYICQQVLFKADSTFEFYDLLHLRGWSVSKGVWKKHGDTILLNSLKAPYIINYYGNSTDANISIKFLSDSFPAAFATVLQDTTKHVIDTSGILVLPKKTLDTLVFSYFLTYSGAIVFDTLKLQTAQRVEIILEQTILKSQYYFNNEKWLFKKDRLYHTLNKDGFFDENKFFQKTATSNLKYSDKY